MARQKLTQRGRDCLALLGFLGLLVFMAGWVLGATAVFGPDIFRP